MELGRRALARGAAAAAVMLALLAAGAAEARKQPRPGPGGTWVERFLLEYRLPEIAPGADRFGPPEGHPAAMPLYRGDEIVGYAFDTWDTVEAVGYSRKPFHILAAIDLEGRLTGVSLSWHVEPITALGRDDDDFRVYLDQFDDHDARDGVQVAFDGALRERTAAGGRQIDGVSRVTISSMLFADALLRSARLVARARGIELSGPSLDLERFDEMTWPELVADGSVSHRAISNGEIAAALGASPPPANPDAVEIEIWAALADPAGIGVHLLGHRGHGRYAVGRSIGDSALFVATDGPRPVLPRADRGRGAERAAVFPALQVTQGATVIRLTEDRFQPIAYFDGEGRPKDAAQGLFRISAEDGFDPARPWRLELALFEEAGATALFAVDYALPERYLAAPTAPAAPPSARADARDAPGASAIERSGFSRRSGDAGFGAPPPPPTLAAAAAPVVTVVADGPDWRAEWRAQRISLIALGATLAALFAILSLQEPLVRRPRLHLAVRIGFLAWTLGWVGWVAGAQLSVLHLINWIQSLEVGFDLDFFLMEPAIFMITVFVAVSALLWGRAAFLRLAVPLRRVTRTSGPPRRAVADPATDGARSRRRAPEGGEIPDLRRSRGARLPLRRPRPHGLGGRTLQDRHHLPVRRAVAGGRLCAGAPRSRSVHRALLLPFHLPARRRPRGARAAAHVRLAETPRRVRQPVPALRTGVPRGRHPRRRRHRHERVLLLPRLPGGLSRLPPLPAAGAPAQAARGRRRRAARPGGRHRTRGVGAMRRAPRARVAAAAETELRRRAALEPRPLPA